MTTRRTNTETQSRVCPLCRETVPTFDVVPSRGYGASDGSRRVNRLREAHALQCKGKIPPDVAADALVMADAFEAAGGDESALLRLVGDEQFRPLAFYRELARALYEQRFPAQARRYEGEQTAITSDDPAKLKRHATEDAAGWFTLAKGVGVRYTCRYCRVEIVESIGGDPANVAVAERLADRHATLCALHVVGGLREPVLSAPRFPDPERPDFK